MVSVFAHKGCDMTPRGTLTFRHAGASARLVPLDKFNYAVSNVWSKTRHQGHASAVMHEIIQYADDHELTLRLVVQAYGRPDKTSLDNFGLVIFYQKFGFVRDGKGWPICMTRLPSQELHGP